MIKLGRRLNFLAFLLYFIAMYISSSLPGGDFIPVIAVAFMLGVYVLEKHVKIKLRKSTYLLYIAAFIVFCILSRFWSEDPTMARNKINGLIFIFVFMTVIYYTQINRITIDEILKIIMYGGYVVVLFMVARHGLRGLMSSVSAGARVGGIDEINGNTVGMCTAYAVVINVYYIIYNKRLHVQDVLLAVGLIVLIATGSRKAFLIAALGICAIFLLKNFNAKKIGMTVLKILAVLLALAVAFSFLLSLPAFSGIMDRMEDMIVALQGGGTRGGTDGWLRAAYNRLGIELFLQHPLLGVGIGNANIYTMQLYGHDHYLHNNYIELLATGGLVGTALYYSIYAYILYVFWKCRKYRDKEFDICLVILVLRLIMDYGAVFYYEKGTYIFLLLFWFKAMQLKRQMRWERKLKLTLRRGGRRIA